MQFLLFTSDMIQALCRTFVHSLWQGILFAVIAALVLLLTKRTSATWRYNILTAVLFLFTGTVLITFFGEFNALQAGERLTTPGRVITGTEIPLTSLSVSTMTGINENPTLLPEKCMDYCTTHASLIVTIWFIFFSIKCLQLLISIGYIQRIRFHKTQDPPVFWKNKMKELVPELGIKKTVVLLESGIIKIPVVIGFLKPVLLMPLGLLSNLPADEIEAVLLHELAHIRRRDYFVNLVQSFAEAVLFFNPAFLWISSLIREERENCCDDMAIAVTHNKIRFIQALVSFQEYGNTDPGYGMAFMGRKNQLLNRVKRIIHHKNKTLSIMEKSLIACSITAIILFSFVPAKKAHSAGVASAGIEKRDSLPLTISGIKMPEVIIPVPAEPETIAPVPAPEMTDTVPQKRQPVIPPAPRAPLASSDGYHFKNITSRIRDNGHSSTVSTEATGTDGKRYRLKKVNGEVKELRINGVKVADEQIKDYRELIGKMEMAGRKDKKEIEKEQLINDIRQKQAAELAKTDWNKVMNEKVKEAMANIDMEKIKMETDKALQKIDWDKMKEDIRKATKEALAELDMEKIKAETEGALQKINWDKMKDNIDQAMKEAQERLKKINMEMQKQTELKQQQKMKPENKDGEEK